ncbi:MAG: hypothetical protein KKD73_00210 [Proteobacteria bacterium]|nr:hypothetical protein [Pseudomonadota bacterium]MBU1639104.1 hypothetical protein [Pseudomonadota bacterium]
MSQDAKKEPVSSTSNKSITDELIMKITKEVVIKFIEVGRLSPPKFAETFQDVHRTVSDAARGGAVDKENA